MSVTSIHTAKLMDHSQRRSIALQSLQHKSNLTKVAALHQVSRKFVYDQKGKAISSINNTFSPKQKDTEVLFYLPVTKKWLCQFVICLILHCKSSFRGISKILKDSFDYNISIGTIHNIFQKAVETATNINNKESLTNIRLAAHDEIFHHNKPILGGVDIDSLYCHLLTKELHRDGETWAINLWDLEKLEFNPERIIADDGDGLRTGHQLAYPNIPCDLDNFHISMDLMKMRSYFRNKLKSSISYRQEIEEKMIRSKKRKKGAKYSWKLLVAKKLEAESKLLSNSIDTLVSWMEHDVLNMPGHNLETRYELFDFILTELNNLAKNHPQRAA